jgi:glycosyltransferase involved in cell wall biosynthesis
VRILTNFMNAPDEFRDESGRTATISREEDWARFRNLLPSADLVVVDCRDFLIYKLAAHLRVFRKPLRVVAVDLVLRKPDGIRHHLTALVKRVLLSRVDHFIHYFKDIAGYTTYFGIRPERSSYVAFKANIHDVVVPDTELREDYVFTMGVSLRDYGTFIKAISELPYPAAIPGFSFDHFEGRGASFAWNRNNIPGNLAILPDTGSRIDLVRNLAKARLVVIPIQASSLCASGISTYLDAMSLGKCVITTCGPGASDVLTDQAILVPPHNADALRDAIARAWKDDAFRRTTSDSGKRYAASLGGEKELLERILSRVLHLSFN